MRGSTHPLPCYRVGLLEPPERSSLSLGLLFLGRPSAALSPKVALLPEEISGRAVTVQPSGACAAGTPLMFGLR
ncbi:hypothetical protein [Nonomuraea sp. CA-141351]|uniref:hypothetical protein n=1 Tax=Nonomuraea sp. CA-141351 TaxID=3239996 RepID=UPI003D8F9503